ncbi:hypothetical protein QUF80_08965 [Desulfococcaceae bacterium HSG8]|nr:hypothetical protein [Desulfococcaceae bacterium HSG8]
MAERKCIRCRGWFPEEEMFYLGIEERAGKKCESFFACEGCLMSNEQDRFYDQVSASGRYLYNAADSGFSESAEKNIQVLSDALLSNGLEQVGSHFRLSRALSFSCA